MSGGHFDYKCFNILNFADELKREIEQNDIEDDGGYAYHFPINIIELLKICQEKIERAGKLAHAIEWLYSGDHSEESFSEIAWKILK